MNEKNEVFLIKHSYVAGWGLPGGGVEVGQTLLDALKTELHEEGNIVLKEEPPIFAIYYNSRNSKRDHVALYVVRAFSQESFPKPNHEIIAHGWFALDALPQDIMRGAKERIEEVLLARDVAKVW